MLICCLAYVVQKVPVQITFHLQSTMEDPVEHSLEPAATNVKSGKKTKTKKRRHTQSESQEQSRQPTGGIIAAFHNITANQHVMLLVHVHIWYMHIFCGTTYTQAEVASFPTATVRWCSQFATHWLFAYANLPGSVALQSLLLQWLQHGIVLANLAVCGLTGPSRSQCLL